MPADPSPEESPVLPAPVAQATAPSPTRPPGGLPHVVVIGAGFAGLAAAARLAQDGYRVTVVEKNERCGGHATLIRDAGYVFDESPDWYAFPDDFERLFAALGVTGAEQGYTLERFAPHYRLFFSPNDILDVGDDRERDGFLFEDVEPGAARRFARYLAHAPAQAERLLAGSFECGSRGDPRLGAVSEALRRVPSLDRLSLASRRVFRTRKLRALLEYPALLLGSSPSALPAAYASFAAEDALGASLAPRGGLHAVAVALERVCKRHGVMFRYGAPVRRIVVEHGRAAGVETDHGAITADAVVASADLAHVDLTLLEPPYRSLDARQWERFALGPGAFVIHIGLRRTLPKLKPLNVFLSGDWRDHGRQVGDASRWPARPSYVVRVPSRVDPSAAPRGCDAITVVVPLGAGIVDDDAARSRYGAMVLQHLEALAGEEFADDIATMHVTTPRDFALRYNAFRGTAYGAAVGRRSSRVPVRAPRLSALYLAGRYVASLPLASSLGASGLCAAAAVHADLNGRPRPLAS